MFKSRIIDTNIEKKVPGLRSYSFLPFATPLNQVYLLLRPKSKPQRQHHDLAPGQVYPPTQYVLCTKPCPVCRHTYAVCR